jgi:hypothetical protein
MGPRNGLIDFAWAHYRRDIHRCSPDTSDLQAPRGHIDVRPNGMIRVRAEPRAVVDGRSAPSTASAQPSIDYRSAA